MGPLNEIVFVFYVNLDICVNFLIDICNLLFVYHPCTSTAPSLTGMQSNDSLIK